LLETNGETIAVGSIHRSLRQPDRRPRDLLQTEFEEGAVMDVEQTIRHVNLKIGVDPDDGKSMLALSRDLGTSCKISFVLAHKLREAMASEVRQRPVGGDGKKAEIDGGYFGGYVKPANRRENRKDRRKPENQSGKRQVVVAIRERGPDGKTLPGVFRSEADALAFIRERVAPKTTLYADEAASWNDLHARFELHRINRPIGPICGPNTDGHGV
jgi:hypothetical protein